MRELVIFNSILIGIVIVLLLFIKRTCRSEKSHRVVLLILPVATVLSHYSSLLYHHLTDNTAMDFLIGNPNLLLPIYPCNVVMLLALILGLLKKESALKDFLTDFLFWFGLPAAVVGMFANVDYFRDPTFLNYDVTKGIVAHALMLLNILALPVLGCVKIKFGKNFLHVLGFVAMLYGIGLYCNLLITVINSPETAYNVNSMFILHSPFPEIEFLKFPVIALAAVILYAIVFHICELFAYPKGDRWYNRAMRFFQNNAEGT